MARFARVVAVDVVHHVTQRGNARQFILASDAERTVYLDLLGNLSDWLGTERSRTTTSGTICQTSISLPFGDGTSNPVNNCNPTPDFFTGKERDAETGLDYFGARYYSNGLGRWVTPDKPFADQHPENPQSWNLYSYTTNNPLRFVDDTGTTTKPAEAKFINDALATDPTLRNVILRSNNFSPAGFENAYKAGELSNLDVGTGNTLRGLAGEAVVIDDINHDLRDPGGAFSQPTNLPGVSPDIGWQLSPTTPSFIIANVATATGATSDVRLGPNVTQMYMEVKSGLSAGSIATGVDQAIKTAAALDKAGLGNSAVSTLVVDAGAWATLGSKQQAALVAKATAGGAYVQVEPGLADAARKRAQDLVDQAHKKENSR